MNAAQTFIYNLNSKNKSNLTFLSQTIKASFQSNEKLLFELRSDCECRKNQNVYVLKNNRNKVSVYNEGKSIWRKKTVVQISEAEFMQRRFTCDPYNVLRRGSNQKVIGFSLYGKNRFYYHKIKDIVKQVKQFYPDWFIRIYYDSSIDKSIICEVECLKNEANTSFVDNTDFCNTNQLFWSFRDFASNNSINANYIHKMMWRWYIYDSLCYQYNRTC
jgi:hypothetical protein